MRTQTKKQTDLNSFCLVLLLLRSEGELNKELLELLIAVVDAKLLKAVGRNMSAMRSNAFIEWDEKQIKLWH